MVAHLHSHEKIYKLLETSLGAISEMMSGARKFYTIITL